MTPDIKSIASSLRSCALALERYNKGLTLTSPAKLSSPPPARTTAAGTIDRRTKVGKAMAAASAKSKGKRASNGVRAH